MLQNSLARQLHNIPILVIFCFIASLEARRCIDAYRSSVNSVGPWSGAELNGNEELFARNADGCTASGFLVHVLQLDLNSYLARVMRLTLSERAKWVVHRFRERVKQTLSLPEINGLAVGFGLCVPQECEQDFCDLRLVVRDYFGLSFNLGSDASWLPAPRLCDEMNVSYSLPRHRVPIVFECFMTLCPDTEDNLKQHSGRAWEGSVLGSRNHMCSTRLVVDCPLTRQSAQLALAEPRQEALAVLVVGVRERFYFLPTLRHVVAPAARAGLRVDYFVSLNWEASHMTTSSHWSKSWLNAMPNPEVTNLTVEALRDRLVRHARHFGARSMQMIVLESFPPRLLKFNGTRRRFFGCRSAEHPNVVNALKRYWQTESLWNLTKSNPAVTYDRVLLTRDDIFWVDDFHIEQFPDTWKVYSTDAAGICDKPLGIPNDRAIVIGGHVADSFFSMYSDYFHNRDRGLDKAKCGEQFLFALAQSRGVSWKIVPPNWFPFSIAMHTVDSKEEEPGKTTMCLRHPSKGRLQAPRSPCVHPSLIRHALCEDTKA